MKLLISLLLVNLSFAQSSMKDQDSKNIKLKIIEEDEVSEYSFKSKIYKLDGTVARVEDDLPIPFIAMDLKPSLDSDKTPDIVWSLDVQAGTVSILSNFTQIPSSTGTRIELDRTTALSYRLYLSAMIKNKHQIRLLYAPLQYAGDSFIPAEDILFDGMRFLAGIPTTTEYKFNSYRLSYMYHFNQTGRVRFRIGLSAKIRDAFTSVSQENGKNSKFSDLGFVPLFHVGALIYAGNKSFFDIDAEGSWAPQGYAIDARASYNYQLRNNFSIGLGVGFLDGGANVESVETYTSAVYGFGRVIIKFPNR